MEKIKLEIHGDYLVVPFSASVYGHEFPAELVDAGTASLVYFSLERRGYSRRVVLLITPKHGLRLNGRTLGQRRVEPTELRGSDGQTNAYGFHLTKIAKKAAEAVAAEKDRLAQIEAGNAARAAAEDEVKAFLAGIGRSVANPDEEQLTANLAMRHAYYGRSPFRFTLRIDAQDADAAVALYRLLEANDLLGAVK